MELKCGHSLVYRCSTCGHCYHCKHKPLFKPKHKLAWVAQGWFWKCPTGAVKPAHIEAPKHSKYLQWLAKQKKPKKKRRHW